VIQLTVSSIFVLFLDELLNKGYGFGSAISLFISVNICENMFWQAFSYRIITTVSGPQYEGAIIFLFSILLKHPTSLSSLKLAFFRTQLPNMSNFIGTVIIFCVVVFLQGFQVEVPIHHTKMRLGQIQNTYPIRLFYTSNTPIMLQSALTSTILASSSTIFNLLGKNFLTHLIGIWKKTPEGHSQPIGGFAYYISSPYSISNIILDPIHTMFYVSFVLTTCSLLSVAWLDISNSSPLDVAKHLRSQNMTIRGYSQKSIHNSPYLKIYIPTAAALGGVCVGILTIFADFMGALGSGTGILLSVSIILTYVEQYLKEVEKNRIKILSKLINLFSNSGLLRE